MLCQCVLWANPFEIRAGSKPYVLFDKIDDRES